MQSTVLGTKKLHVHKKDNNIFISAKKSDHICTKIENVFVKTKVLKGYNCLLLNCVSSTISIYTVIQEILCHGVMTKLVFLLKNPKTLHLFARYCDSCIHVYITV